MPEPEPPPVVDKIPQRDVSPMPGPNADGSMGVRDAPDIIAVIGATHRAIQAESYPERVARLQGEIDSQVDAARAVADRNGTDLTKAKVVYAFDVGGDAVHSCEGCGREGCKYASPGSVNDVLQRDMLEDAVTVAQEVATQLGISYGLIAYDHDVVPLREVMPPDNLSDRSEVLDVFATFRQRDAHPDPAQRDWLRQMMARWEIEVDEASDAAADKPSINLAIQMLHAANTDGPSAIVLGKGRKPPTSLRPLEAAAKVVGIVSVAVSFGPRAEANARNMFSKTLTATASHSVVEKVAVGTGDAVSNATGD